VVLLPGKAPSGGKRIGEKAHFSLGSLRFRD